MSRGDAPEEVASFCAREYPRLVGALGLYTGDPLLAEELAQEALARACRDWGRVGDMDAPGAWVHRVAVNLANSHFRRRAASRRAAARLQAGTPPIHHDSDAAEVLTVREAVAGLTRRRRTAVVLSFFLGHSNAETAELMGATEATVRSLLHRARSDLRQQLEVHESAEEHHD